MAFDGLLVRRAVAEIRAALSGARVERVYQPEPRLLWLHFYRPDGSGAALVACTSPRLQRLHVSRQGFANPPQPPVFCMVLRKHLLGARLVEIRQEGLERMAELEFARRGQPPLRLKLELLAQRPNAVLVDDSDRVLDALERAPAGSSRPLYPGAAYVPPPARPAWAPDLPPAQVEERLRAALAEAGPAWRLVVRAAPGLGGDAAREICLRAGMDPLAPPPAERVPALARALADAVAMAERGAPPSAVWKDGVPVAVAALPLERLAAVLGGSLRLYAGVGELADEVYGVLAERERERALRNALQQILEREHARAARRLAARLEDEAGLEDPERLRLMAELLTAHLHLVPRGARTVRVPNYYDPEQREIEIPLDPSIPPSENARRYFARYQRARRAALAVREKIAEARQEVEYLESLLYALEQAEGLSDLAALREEMAAAGLVRPEPARPGSPAQPPAGPLSARSSDGWVILVGRNNRENERLTFKVAAADDYWLHAKAVAGAHVILRPPDGRPAEPPPRTLEEAALLAAYFSRARQGSNVPVDVTRCRYVRKPRGARPGMVVYEGHRTVFVTPDPERVRQLLAGQGRA